MKRYAWLVFVVLSIGMIGVTQQKPVPADEEPKHKVLFKNDQIRVIRATLQPGESTLYHVHDRDRAGVDLVSSTTVEQKLGQPEQSASTSKAGEVFAEDCAAHPKTHRVRNVGNGVGLGNGYMDVIYVDILQPPSGVASSAAGPIAAEIPSARVYNWVLPAGATTPMHTHERPYVIISATPMLLKMAAPDGGSFQHETGAGDFHWVDQKVTHSLSNQGKESGQIVEVELK